MDDQWKEKDQSQFNFLFADSKNLDKRAKLYSLTDKKTILEIVFNYVMYIK